MLRNTARNGGLGMDKDKKQKDVSPKEIKPIQMVQGLEEELPEEDLDKVGGGSWSPCVAARLTYF